MELFRKHYWGWRLSDFHWWNLGAPPPLRGSGHPVSEDFQNLGASSNVFWMVHNTITKGLTNMSSVGFAPTTLICGHAICVSCERSGKATKNTLGTSHYLSEGGSGSIWEKILSNFTAPPPLSQKTNIFCWCPLWTSNSFTAIPPPLTPPLPGLQE